MRYGRDHLYGAEASDNTDRVMSLSGFGDGTLRLSPSAAFSDSSHAWSTLIADGKRIVAVGHYPGSIAVFDASDPTTAPRLIKSEELRGQPLDVTVHGDKAFCSLGMWGLHSVSLTD